MGIKFNGRFGRFNGRFNRKGFVFSFLAIFIAFLLIAFAHLYLQEEDFTQDNVFRESRILKVDREISYFKNIYLKNTLSFSYQNVIQAILNDQALVNSLSLNHSRLNALVMEGIVNGSLDGSNIPFLENKTLSYFHDEFNKSFSKNLRGSFSYKLLSVNVFERDPFYIKLQFDGIYNITTEDNISQWNFYDKEIVSIPIINLDDPEFSAHGFSKSIKPAELYASDSNWDIDLLKEAIDNYYATTYVEFDHDYLIGSSFLKRLLNFSTSSYLGVAAYWTFDKDLERNGVYDLTLLNPLGKHFGNTYLLMNFDEEDVRDISAYNNSASMVGGVTCDVLGMYKTGCDFDGVDGYLEIDKDVFDLTGWVNLSISGWIYPRAYIDGTSGLDSYIFSYGSNGGPSQTNFGLNSDNKLFFEINKHGTAGAAFLYRYESDEDIVLNQWSYVTIVFEGETGIGKLYINGKIQNVDSFGNYEIGRVVTDFIKSPDEIGIGDKSTGVDNHFNGMIDEFAVYNKSLSEEDVSRLYKAKRALFIDYKDSLYGQGIEFDGKDDYVDVELDSNMYKDMGVGDFTVEAWIKPYENKPWDIVTFNDKLSLGYNGTTLIMNPFHGSISKITKATYTFEPGKYYHIVGIYDHPSGIGNGNSYLYINGNQVSTTIQGGGIWAPNIDVSPFTIGSGARASNSVSGEYFKGVIDEVKIYRRVLSPEEIKMNYYNYPGNSKGCCNYLTLINPNDMGYVGGVYDHENSYSSKLFYDYHDRGIDWDVTLVNITNITGIDYPNFLLDICAMEAYNIYSYNHTKDPFEFVTSGSYNFTCSKAITGGVY